MYKKISLSLFLILLISSCSNESNKQTSELTNLIEKENVLNRVNTLFVETDNRNWDLVKECFADSVHFDMTSLVGGDPAMLSSQNIVDAWDEGLKSLEAVHHQIGNYIVNVNGNSAEVFCYGIASHYLPNNSGRNVRTFVGSYNFNLSKINDDWKIDKFKFNFKYMDGNPDLEKS